MPLSLEQMRALPVAMAFGHEDRMINGRNVRVPVQRKIEGVFLEEDQPNGYRDETGSWRLVSVDGVMHRQMEFL